MCAWQHAAKQYTRHVHSRAVAPRHVHLWRLASRVRVSKLQWIDRSGVPPRQRMHTPHENAQTGSPNGATCSCIVAAPTKHAAEWDRTKYGAVRQARCARQATERDPCPDAREYTEERTSGGSTLHVETSCVRPVRCALVLRVCAARVSCVPKCALTCDSTMQCTCWIFRPCERAAPQPDCRCSLLPRLTRILRDAAQ